LAYPGAGAETFRAEAGAQFRRIGVAILRHQDARHPAFGLVVTKAFQGTRQEIVTVAGSHDHGNVGVGIICARAHETGF